VIYYRRVRGGSFARIRPPVYLALSLVRHLIGAARVAAIARQLNGIARIMTICAAILFAFRGSAVASRMRTLLKLGHMASLRIV
jgi:hypothetical protein